MDKELFREKSVGVARIAIMYFVSAIFLLLSIGILILIFEGDAMPAFMLLLFVCIAYMVYAIAAAVAMGKAYVAVYENHVEGKQYSVVYVRGYSLEYNQILEIQRSGAAIIISTQSNKYSFKSKNADKIYSLLMENWKKNRNK